ncbi:MAG: Mur ligase family protein [Alphaproteobacteria bacterium]
MRAVQRQVYPGPSIHSPRAHARLLLDIDGDGPSAAEIARRVARRIGPTAPDLARALVTAMRPGADAAAIVAAFAARLIDVDGLGPLPAAATRTEGGRWRVAVAIEEPAIAAGALDLAAAAAMDDDRPCGAALDAYHRAVAAGALPPGIRLQWRAARRRGIPGRPLFRDAPVLLLGHGRHQHRLAGAVGPHTTAVAAALAGDPALAGQLVRRAGVGWDATAAADHHLTVVGGRVVAAARRRPDGGWADATDALHDRDRRAAAAVARQVGLDVAGIRATITGPAASEAAVAMTVAAVDPDPAVALHRGASGGDSLADALVARMFPPGADGRIPIAAITGTNGKTTTARMVACILRVAGRRVGLADTTGVEIDGRIVLGGDRAGVIGAGLVLGDPGVEVAVLETARGGIRRDGIAFERCTVAAVLNIGDDHVGTDGIADRAALARVKGLVVEVADDMVVLSAVDPLCVAMRARSPAARACWVALDPGRLPALGPGDLAVTLAGRGDDARLVLRDEAGETVLAPVTAIAAADGGRARHNLENAAFAAAVAVGLRVPHGAVAEGLARYDLGFATTRGRLAISDARPFRVVVDYGHNAPAIAAVRAWAAATPVAGRRLCMLNAPGNRIDAHYADLAAAAAGGFDRYFCTGPDQLRGRASGEVARRLADGLLAAGVPAAAVSVIADEAAAVPAVLGAARPGDLVVLFCHDPARSWGQVHGR